MKLVFPKAALFLLLQELLCWRFKVCCALICRSSRYAARSHAASRCSWALVAFTLPARHGGGRDAVILHYGGFTNISSCFGVGGRWLERTSYY